MSWTEQAECAATDSYGNRMHSLDLWHAAGTDDMPVGEAQAWNRFRVQMAQYVCADCPVAQRCFEDGLELDERHAIRGGVDFSMQTTGELRAKRLANARARFVKKYGGA